MELTDDEARKVLVEVLTYHQRVSASHCACGWSVLGASFAEHDADVFFASLRARFPDP